MKKEVSLTVEDVVALIDQQIRYWVGQEQADAFSGQTGERSRAKLEELRHLRAEISASDELQEIEARLHAATEGPWHRGQGYEQEDPGHYIYSAQDNIGLIVYADAEGIIREVDREFIAHAPSDIRWLLDEVKRLRGNDE